LKLGRKGLVNEKRKLLPSKKSSAGGVLAGTTGRALPNRHPYMVGRWRVMYRHAREVRAMNCDRCGQVMREGTHYWGEYCQTKNCFNSELARLIYGARIKREKASK
jgi:hypothetical protein